jgi:DNA-binding transcriptional MerR regulator
MPTRYPIRAVAKLTGISPETIRAWERRYQAVVPERTDRGRQYGPAQIERLRRLNQLVQRGHAIGTIAALTDEELDALETLPDLRSERLASSSGKTHELLFPVIAAIEAFDSARASDELGRLAAVLAPRDFVYQAVLPLMQEVGTRWHDGRFAIAQEHLVSQLLRNLLGGMIRMFRPSSSSRKMLVAAPAGEQHEFGILAAAMLAAMGGIEPVYLGVDLPAREIATGARLVVAPVVLLGLTVATDQSAAEVETLARTLPATTALWLGGAAAASLDLSRAGRPVVVLADLQAFETECRQWRP